MPNHKIINPNFDTLTSTLSSKFSDSPPPSHPPSLHHTSDRTQNSPALTRNNSNHSYPPSTANLNPPVTTILIPIPNRNSPHRAYAWVNYLDPLGPGPNTPTKHVAPSPERYPVRISTPKFNKNDDLSGHGWSLIYRWEYNTWDKLKRATAGNKPLILCKTDSPHIWCDICSRRNLLLYIGGEVNLGGGWGNGSLTRIIRHEAEFVVVRAEGPNIRTPSNSAKVRIPIDKFHLTRKARLTRWYLKLRGTIKTAPITPEVTEEPEREERENQVAT
ncbi:hypothetical protein QCA50_010907 [Cerrena zonata]|uniref:Uncharacterized protein n=1 Tax=Cerrena zonata TaxID=2478898 RepID=A0AAW0GAJ0_9APHY